MIQTHLFCISVFFTRFLFFIPYIIVYEYDTSWLHVHVHSVVPIRIIKLKLYSFVCVCTCSSHLRKFYSFGDFTIIGEELHILTYTPHSWPWSIEGSLTYVPHLPWHGASVYNGHLRGPVTLTPVAEYLAVELSLPVLRWYGTPCNIYKDERVRLHLPQKCIFENLTKEIKTKTGTRFEPATHGLLDYTSTT